MKTIRFFVLFILITSFSPVITKAVEWESPELVNRLLTIPEPGAPVIHENFVIFTADSSLRRVGVAFAHEDFANIYWFRRLLVSQDNRNPVILPGEKIPGPHRDSGMQFHVQQIPDHLREIEYRLVINGLWTKDPANPHSRRDPVSGLTMSVLRLPPRQIRPNPLNGLPEGVQFMFHAPPGESISVAGDFNSWDPFMYELAEGPAGVYSLIIPLPPGSYQYVFYYRGQKFNDPNNPQRVYSRDGSSASVVIVP